MRKTPYQTAVGAAHYWFDPLAKVVVKDLQGHFEVDEVTWVAENKQTKHVRISIVKDRDVVHEYLNMDDIVGRVGNPDYDRFLLQQGWFGVPDQAVAKEIRNAIPESVKNLDDAAHVLGCLQELSRGEAWFVNAEGQFHIGQDMNAMM